MKLTKKQLKEMMREAMGPKSPSDYLKPHLKKHAKYGTDPDRLSTPYDSEGRYVGSRDYGGSYEDYRDNIDSPFFYDHMAQFDEDDSDVDPNEAEAQFVNRALADLEDEGYLTDHGKRGSEGYEFHGRGESDEELGLVDDKGSSQLYERRILRKMILQEMSGTNIKDLDTSGIYRPQGSDINKQIAVELLKSVISDLQNVPERNFEKYIQHLINYQIPNIIRTLES